MIVQYADTARRQMLEIWRYSRRNWGDARADRYVRALEGVIGQIAAGTRRARACPEVLPGLSVIRSGSHSIYLTMDAKADLLLVVAVLHQRMEPSKHIRDVSEGE